ncbi:hypothetical protein XENTR_v10015927 [Xenopus tropicalis]|nr:hypothetical protein XENTR_v10015927 [Xenopus tropicalis]
MGDGLSIIRNFLDNGFPDKGSHTCIEKTGTLLRLLVRQDCQQSLRFSHFKLKSICPILLNLIIWSFIVAYFFILFIQYNHCEYLNCVIKTAAALGSNQRAFPYLVQHGWIIYPFFLLCCMRNDILHIYMLFSIIFV